jgi:hypothetical protein
MNVRQIVNDCSSTAFKSVKPSLFKLPSFKEMTEKVSMDDQLMKGKEVLLFRKSYQLDMRPGNDISLPSVKMELKQPKAISITRTIANVHPYQMPMSPTSCTESNPIPDGIRTPPISPINSASGHRYKSRRIPQEQLKALQEMYDLDKYPSRTDRFRLAKQIEMDPKDLQIWFQNKRRQVSH